MPHLRYYITGHGLGHASRSCQVLHALAARHPGLRCTVVSDAAAWFLADNLPPSVAVVGGGGDVGVCQNDSLEMQLDATVQACHALRARAPAWLAREAATLSRTGTDLVVTDVAALPCAAAAMAGVPAVILSNFTWDWIYAGFLDTHPAFAEIGAWLHSCYRQARWGLRLPFHGPLPVADCLDLPLVVRRSRTPRPHVRRALGIRADQRLALLSFGGFGLERAPLDGVTALPEWIFMAELPLVAGNPRLRPLPGNIPYPDLLNAADVVITKPGYGIVSECIAHQVPVLYTPRGNFREQPLLIDGLQRYSRAVAIDNQALRHGHFAEAFERLFALPQPPLTLATNGAAVAADQLARLLA